MAAMRNFEEHCGSGNFSAEENHAPILPRYDPVHSLSTSPTAYGGEAAEGFQTDSTFIG